MEPLTVAKFIGALLAALGGPALLVRVSRFVFPDEKERLRAEIERDVDLLAKLPESSKAHDVLLASLESDLRGLKTEMAEASRNVGSILLGVLLFVLAIAASAWAWGLDGWWQVPVWLVAATLTLLGGAGLSQGAKKTVRDERGNPVQRP